MTTVPRPRLALAAFLVACGPPPAPAPIENIAPIKAPPQACAGGRLSGTVIVTDRDREPAIGATLVATFGSDDNEQVTITDEHGKFTLTKLEAHRNLVLYFEDRSFFAPLPRGCEPVIFEIAITTQLADPGSAQPMRVRYASPPAR